MRRCDACGSWEICRGEGVRSAFEPFRGACLEACGDAVPFRNMISRKRAVLEAVQGQIDSFFRQLPHKCHLEEVSSVRG